MSIPFLEASQSSTRSRESSPQCQGCLRSAPGVAYCSVCGLSLCDRCWDGQLVHRPGFLHPGGIPHVKIEPWVAQHINNIFLQPQDPSRLDELHAEDEKSAWFGIERFNDRSQPLLFQDYGRYADLMTRNHALYRPKSSSSGTSSSSSDAVERHPSLVSFVGQTGAGKSTIIKLLVESISNRPPIPNSSPVIGMIGKDVPTSKDVHLYLDPSTATSQAPLLYADCEGLDGGEREPVASRFRIERTQRDSYVPATTPRGRHHVEREIHWAKSHAHRTRHFAVSSFYPRILFTFSDVVVFVHRNSRVIEPVLEKLIEWAETALETSSNQPILPSAILAINASESGPNSEAWDSELATKTLLDSLTATVDQNVTFSKYAKIWRGRGRSIGSMEELFMCYFSSFKVIHVPTNLQPGLMHEQIKKLHSEILRGSLTIRERKSSLRMLLNVQELQSYLQDAFEHFSRTIDVPFDFVQAAFANRRIPITFGGNILELAVAMMKRQSKLGARAIFDKLSFFVASCIMLDAVRNTIKGTADHIFPHYIEHLDNALQGFCDNHWPCEYASYDVVTPHLDMQRSDMWLQETTLHRCINVKSGHASKGHQMNSGYIFAHGPYEAKFTFERYRNEFHTAVYSRLRRLIERQAELESFGETQETAALLIHREDILKFFFDGNKGNDEKSLLKLRACLSCLFNHPEHALSCGHVLCTACVRGYGTPKGKNTIQILDCPLDGTTTSQHRPRIVNLKPDSAGVRILALEDAGVRSFAQLKILRLIESEFNGKISIQHLFDLVVSKGAGSVIALHLANDRWASGSCSVHLEKILRGGFNRAQVKSMPTISRKHGFFPKHRYHSKGLQTVLKTAFTEKRTLLDTPDGQGAALKAAIIAGTSGRPMVFTNYRNSMPSTSPYDVHWPDDIANELKAWEVVRASMSNPKYFKSYRHAESKQTFCEPYSHKNLFLVAGGETKRVFARQPTNYPDIFLSIGSGCSLTRHDSASQLSSTKRNKNNDDVGGAPHELWDDFLSSLPSSAPLDKFLRIDPSFDNLPELDDLDGIESVQESVKSHIDAQEIRTIALRLFANLFYFEPDEDNEDIAEDGTVRGTILCRLPSDMVVVRDVGKLFQTNRFVGSNFVVEWDGLVIQKFPISAITVEGMMKDHQFHMPAAQIRLPRGPNPVDVRLQLPNMETYSISGFPRLFKSQKQKDMKSEDKTMNPRPSWNPPTLERLALVDLGPLKSPLTSNASYRALRGRSSSSVTNSTNHDNERSQIPELSADRGPYELEAPRNPIPNPHPEESPVTLQSPDKISILQAVRESEKQQRVAEREALRRLARREAAETSRPFGTARATTPPRVILPLPKRSRSRIAKEREKRVSESSEDEIFGQIISSPTIRHFPA